MTLVNPPSLHAIAAMILTLVMFYAFASGRVRVEIISLLTISLIAVGLYFFPLPGDQSSDGLKLAFEGFGHHALITICALMVMGRGLVVTGALDPAARVLARVWRHSQHLGLLMTLLVAMVLSMLVNDTPVLVLMLPILTTLASRGGMPASRTLIPVNAAVLIGGMATTIGTSTNLLVVSIASDLGMPPMSVFHFTPVVLMAVVVALPFIWLAMPRLLPDNSRQTSHRARRFFATLRLSNTSQSVGKSLDDLKRHLPDEIHFDETSNPAGTEGRLRVVATHDALEEAMRALKATAAPAGLIERLQAAAARVGEDIHVMEVAIASDSGLIGKLIVTSGVADRYDVAILGLHEARRSWREPAQADADSVLEEGDILLVTGTMPNLQNLARMENLLILEGAREMPRTVKAPLALLLMAGAIIPASLGLVPIVISSLIGAILMFVTGCVRFDRVGRALSGKVIVLVAASIAVGRIILDSGAAGWLGQLIAAGLQHFPPAADLAIVMLFVTILTNFASNTAAAAIGTPIAFSLAQHLHIPPEPLVLAVLFGCNLCYVTPVAYQTNMLIMSSGDYTFRDYVRTGLPLAAIMIAAFSLILVIRYGMY